jgi:hypothetical protein
VSKRLASLALVVGLAIIAAGCGGGSSSDSSSEWSASDAAQTESKLADTLTAEGVTPTKAETECIRKGLEPLASPSEVLGNTEPSSQQREEIEELTTTCLGGEQTGTTESASGGEPESLYSGPACEEELASSGCIQEVEERESKAIAEGEETYGDGAEEAGTEGSESGEVNPGLQEMDEELQQEYEEEGVTP